MCHTYRTYGLTCPSQVLAFESIETLQDLAQLTKDEIRELTGPRGLDRMSTGMVNRVHSAAVAAAQMLWDFESQQLQWGQWAPTSHSLTRANQPRHPIETCLPPHHRSPAAMQSRSLHKKQQLLNKMMNGPLY
jgi:hypothetical protein